MNINNFLDSKLVYCINLDKRPERWNIAEKNIRDIGFKNLLRFSAIDGSKFNKKDLINTLSVRAYHDLETEKETHQGIYSKGAVGCYLSHILLWKKLLESTEDYMIIFEDDITFPLKEKFNKEVENILLNLLDFDFLFLGWGRLVDKPKSLNNYLYQIKGLFFGLHFYIITKRGALKALEKAFPIEMQLDNYLSYISETNNLTLFASKENLGFQSTSFFNSDIQSLCIKCDLPANPLFYAKIIALIFILIIIIILILYFNKKKFCQ